MGGIERSFVHKIVQLKSAFGRDDFGVSFS